MGSYFELNDTLQITTEQGFPAHIFNRERHAKKPIDPAKWKDRIFRFEGKQGARLFHLDPVRVFLVHNIDGKWLAWGHVVILEQTIRKLAPKADANAKSSTAKQPSNLSDPKAWETCGKFRVVEIYDPEYQKLFSLRDTPPGMSYFS